MCRRKDVAPVPHATATVTLWQRWPVAQSPSLAQYFRHAMPMPATDTQPVPRAQGRGFEHALPAAPQSAPGWQSTTAVVPWQRKSHF